MKGIRTAKTPSAAGPGGRRWGFRPIRYLPHTGPWPSETPDESDVQEIQDEIDEQQQEIDKTQQEIDETEEKKQKLQQAKERYGKLSGGPEPPVRLTGGGDRRT